ncbi:hypothetical protein [Nocardioides sp. W7]|uniref:hypothetical protein n=1 Tax=Nocardioides sp. W7 TaxID=2931390 RepID=UPI001FD2F68D|nr:hypothetical protein [Nocardioides sp. W7]
MKTRIAMAHYGPGEASRGGFRGETGQPRRPQYAVGPVTAGRTASGIDAALLPVS